MRRPSCAAATYSAPSCCAGGRRGASWRGGLTGRTAGLRARGEHARARFGPGYSVRQGTVVAAAKEGSTEGVSDNAAAAADAKIDELRQRKASSSTVRPSSIIH